MTFDYFEHLEFDDGANMTWNGVKQTYSRFGWEIEHGVLLHVVPQTEPTSPLSAIAWLGFPWPGSQQDPTGNEYHPNYD